MTTVSSIAVHRLRLAREPASKPLTEFLHPGVRDMAHALWWQHAGALLIMQEMVLLSAFNSKSMPTRGEYLDGRLRGLSIGQCVEYDDLLSPDDAIICEAFRRGMTSKGCSLFLALAPGRIASTRCVQAGFKRLLYSGILYRPNLRILESGGVEVVRVTV